MPTGQQKRTWRFDPYPETETAPTVNRAQPRRLRCPAGRDDPLAVDAQRREREQVVEVRAPRRPAAGRCPARGHALSTAVSRRGAGGDCRDLFLRSRKR